MAGGPWLILFDIDGTLIDTAGAGRRAMEQAFQQRFDIESISERARGVRFAGMTDRRIIDELLRAAGLPADGDGARGELESAYLEALETQMRRQDPRRRILPGVARTLVELEARAAVHLGLLTGNLEAGARIKLEPFDLNRYFPGGGYGSDHRDRREVARIAHDKLSRLYGIIFDPARVVVVGDTELDVRCAKSNGFRSLAVLSGWGAVEAIHAEGPDAVLDDLSDRSATLRALGLPPRSS